MGIWPSAWHGSLVHHPAVHVIGSENHRQSGEIFVHQISHRVKASSALMSLKFSRLTNVHKLNPETVPPFLHLIFSLNFKSALFCKLTAQLYFCKEWDLHVAISYNSFDPRKSQVWIQRAILLSKRSLDVQQLSIPLLYPRDLSSNFSFNSYQINYKEQMFLNAQGEYD